uniref:Uncharacterized protein n=1 Tax=Cannabis sativa TaxID=3483 RepID=A0A803P8B6_CANSA
MISLSSLLRFKTFHRVILICAIVFLIGDSQALENEEMNIKRSDFPNDFAFGVATSAGQIEGSANKGGRTPSVWDTYAAIPGNIEDGSNPSTAIDSYNRYKEDIEYIKELGTNYYRFSISWTRILPKGSLRGGVNKEGIDHYNNLIDELISNGITPFVTILHFDTPQALENRYGGFLNGSIVDDFKDYCELLFKTYGDRVKNWITINEPFVVALGYDIGLAPTSRCSLPPPIGPCKAGNSSIEPYIVAHNLILAHARAAKLYKKKYQATGTNNIYSYPQGLQKLLEFMSQKYQNITIYITENGIPEASVPDRHLEDYVNDDYRIMFILQHLYYVNQAIKNGVNVKGYFYWSLFDSFEGEHGYNTRFGLFFIDYNNNYKRIPKKSAKWLHCFLKHNITQPSTLLEESSMFGSNTTQKNNESPNGTLTTAAVSIIGTFIGFFALFVLPTFCETEEQLMMNQSSFN